MHGKLKKLVFSLTIIFSVLIFAGLVFLVTSRKDFQDIMFDSVVLLISAASIAIAFFAQLGADNERRRLEKVIKNINEIDRNIESDIKTDESIRRKLDRILSLEEEIYHRVGGRKDVKKVERAPNETTSKDQ
jgi:hypothetical protein